MKIELKKNCCIKGEAFQIGDTVELEEGTDLNYLLAKGFAVKADEKPSKSAKEEKTKEDKAEQSRRGFHRNYRSYWRRAGCTHL